ncbi:hypothetical protein P4110_18100 [Pseudomonas aeruginosa]|nr:hypothetical protein [Pseudomonas aeruginosa]
MLAHADPRSGSQQLSAFVVPRQQDGDARAVLAAIKTALRQELPDYMLPSRYLSLDSLPTTVNGKIDRQALRRHLDEQCQERLDEQRFGTPANCKWPCPGRKCWGIPTSAWTTASSRSAAIPCWPPPWCAN